MLSKWMQRIKSLFETEHDDHEIDKKSIPTNRTIQSRVKYQYPQKGNNTLPHTPPKLDRVKEITDRQQNNNDRLHNVDRKEHYPVQIGLTRQLENQNTGQPEAKAKPFRPTEVPSPIYGYQKQCVKEELDHTPAFVRQRRKSANDLETTKEAVDEERESINEKANIRNENDDRHGDHQKELSHVADTIKETTEPYNGAHDQRREKRKTPTKKKDEHNKSLPFNVMMSANDKYMLHKKQPHPSNIQSSKQVEKGETALRVPYHLLDDPIDQNTTDEGWLKEQRQLLEKTLRYFKVQAKVVHTTQGPTVTRFEVQPEMGVKVSKIKNLSDDLKLNMAAKDIRIEAPIPGKHTIGIEVPNPKAQMVGLQEIFAEDMFRINSSPLTVGLGMDIEGTPAISNIQKMPHGLIAGATGSGKSVCINTILVSLIYKANYDEVKLLLIDPKMVELAPYNGIPHLLSPVITDVKAATMALKWAVQEMEERYDKLAHEGVRDIERYNQKMEKENRTDEHMPFIVIVIDELADLMMISPQDVEDAISRIAQKARACGIHLLLATQRPSVDVITGLIKANIPTRIAFSVSSQVDSRTIIDTNGAEKLLGKGDMLLMENGTSRTVRLQGAFVSDEEIERVTSYARSIKEPDYAFEEDHLLAQLSFDEEEDELLQEAILFVTEQNRASTSLLQRHFKIGYNRAARLMDAMEERGIIAGQNGSKPREVLISTAQVEEMDV
ncbi:DNA translocase FtsK [Oceanobacillus halotolerans]|uniref:DNA translocase FtsK n=1 Tax=Oceanobacillus halotolerans TaxID=2663380 RepID=UPI0013DA4945|nr:DNA translocase FtsK [Oceanobacillus halotolerans]